MSHPITEAELEAWRHLSLQQWSHEALRAEVQRLRGERADLAMQVETARKAEHEALWAYQRLLVRTASAERENAAMREIVEDLADSHTNMSDVPALCHHARRLLGKG